VIHAAADGDHEAERSVDLDLVTGKTDQSHAHVLGPVHVTGNAGVMLFTLHRGCLAIFDWSIVDCSIQIFSWLIFLLICIFTAIIFV